MPFSPQNGLIYLQHIKLNVISIISFKRQIYRTYVFENYVIHPINQRKNDFQKSKEDLKIKLQL